ncbi:MAG: hypothetical protein L0Y80_00985 [Ignavibacteriae bacterium]|nr:hypothetical protein [Ignavibacteriota bacterium]
MKKIIFLLTTFYLILATASHAQYPIRNYVSLQDNTTHLHGASGGFLIKQLLPNGSGTRFTSFAAYRDSSIFYAAGNEKLRIAGTALTASDDILPGTTAAYDFGATGTRWRNLWLSGSATIGAVAGTTGQLSLKGNLHIEATGNSNQLRLLHDGTTGYLNTTSGGFNLQFDGSSQVFFTSGGSATLNGTLAVNGTGLSTFASDVRLTKTTGFFAVNSAAAAQRQISFETNLLRRFVIVGANSTAESGSNTGSNFNIARYNDAGTFIENALSITRSDGTVSIGQNLIASGTGTSSFNRDLRMFPTSGGTHNGNILISYSDQYPAVLWRSGSTNKAQIIGDVNGGNITIDRVGGSFTIRDAINGGNSDFIVASGGNATLRGNLNVNGGVLTVGGSAGTNTIALGVVNALVRNTVTGETTFITNNSNLVLSPTNGNVIVNSDLAVNGGEVTTTAASLRLIAGGGGVLRFLGEAITSEILAENNHSRWGNRRDDAVQENIDIGVYTNGTTWNSRLLLNSTGATIAGDVGVNGGDLTSSANTFNLLNSSVQTLNLGGASTATTIGATSGSTTVRNNTYIGDQKNFGSASFASGFTGAGYQSFYKDSEYWFETDNVNIRGSLSAYGLLIQQIRATNGSIYVSSVQKVDTVIDATAGAEIVDMEDPGSNNVAYFAEGDIVLTQRVRIDDSDELIKRIVRVVDSTSGKRVWFTSATGGPADTGIIEDGDEFVRIGSETDAARSGSVYLTADDTEAPYIDVVDGVASWTDFRSIAKNKVRLGKLTGVTDADFGGALSGYGLYTTQGYFKGNIHVKSGISQALQNNAIQIGNITGVADSAIKIANTGTASTSGIFGYNSSGNETFRLSLADSAKIAGSYFSNTHIWSGNPDINNAATNFLIGAFGNGNTPKLSLGASASAVTVANSNPGFVATASGEFKVYRNGSNFIRMQGDSLAINASDFNLVSGNLQMFGNDESSFFKLGTLTSATNTATTNSGFRADNSGNVLIKGSASGSDYVKITGGGGIDINASTFKLLAGSPAGYLGVQSGTGTVKTFFSGATAPDGTGANFYVQANGFTYADSGTVGGWTLGSTSLTGGQSTLNSAGWASFGSGNDFARIDATDATYRLWIGNQTAGSAPFRVTKAGAVTATSGSIGGWTLGTSTLSSGVVSINSTDKYFQATANAGTMYVNVGQTRNNLGQLTGSYGISVVEELVGEYFRLDNSVRRIAGWDFTTSQFSATNLKLISGAANVARMEIGTGSNIAGVNSPNAATDVAFWAGATHTNRATAPLRIYADGLIYSENSPYDLANTAELYDDFITVPTSTVDTVSIFGWVSFGLSSFGPGNSEDTEGRIGMVGIYNNSSSPGGLRISSAGVDINFPATYWFSAKTNFSTSSNWRGAVGLFEEPDTWEPNNGIYFKNEGGNWIAVTRNDATSTTTDTGVGQSVSYKQFKIVVESSSSVKFYIDGNLEATHTTNIPNGIGYALFSIRSAGGGTRSMDIDYFQMRMTGLNR